MFFRKISSLILFILIIHIITITEAAEVKLVKDERGWLLTVDEQPFFIRGMCYTPTAIGENADDNTRRDWMIVDDDFDGRNDYGYQTWVDANRNNKRDPNEKEVGDFQLMKDMGVNTIRLYHHSSNDYELKKINEAGSLYMNHAPNKEVLREMYEKYGLYVAMGDLVGSYGIGSGASWTTGTDYTDPQQKANMLKSVEEMVLTFKDEPYILLWILGNENNLNEFTRTQAYQQPQAYAEFLNEAALLIKKLDGKHPVALCNGAYGLLEDYAKHAPAIDIFGVNLYSNNGFYELWKKVHHIYDRPVMLTEFGTSHPIVKDGVLRESYQADIHRRAWSDIAKHRHGKEFPGNAIGGFVFQWADEWWYNGDKWHQNISPVSGGWNLEYNGMTSFGDGSSGSLTRQLRQVYSTYQEMWVDL
ncbi:MAG: hypothetical protein KBD53_07985 [Candidatus Omnitrophica bacterium]|nr:hypothetical protein [Candidatus Omnitrophota bacterium]